MILLLQLAIEGVGVEVGDRETVGDAISSPCPRRQAALGSLREASAA